MNRTRIKICGITRPHDARAAVDAGADAIGMILHANAPRRISIEIARQIADAVPDEIEVVGVFVDADPALIVEMASELELDQVQLHGREPPEDLESLRDLTVIKAIHDESEFSAWRAAAGVRAFLFESGRGAHAGGNGIESDWDTLIPTGVERDRMIVAGGLRPDNVAGVIKRLRPWSVDVSSGVEERLGEKSVEKLRAFCAAVRAV
jgi:phosphoribosylanthranilate isomerase